MKPEIVPATPELLERFYGGKPPRTARSIVVVRGDEVLGVAGVFVYDARLVMFAELTPELRRDKRTIIRGIREVLKMTEGSRLPVYAEADPNIEGSDRLLLHMGFQPSYREVYSWPH